MSSGAVAKTLFVVISPGEKETERVEPSEAFVADYSHGYFARYAEGRRIIAVGAYTPWSHDVTIKNVFLLDDMSILLGWDCSRNVEYKGEDVLEGRRRNPYEATPKWNKYYVGLEMGDFPQWA